MRFSELAAQDLVGDVGRGTRAPREACWATSDSGAVWPIASIAILCSQTAMPAGRMPPSARAPRLGTGGAAAPAYSTNLAPCCVRAPDAAASP
ncbi:hypothetical protein BDZ91DRAFT_139300 [Kalaharituber pfeilii]|nr:hypothetical protein BDZ91DRAFT_139300 [Kalaharituber pfeilii]